MKNYFNKKWNGENKFYYISHFGHTMISWADENDPDHLRLAEIGNFFWTREEVELAKLALKKTLSAL